MDLQSSLRGQSWKPVRCLPNAAEWRSVKVSEFASHRGTLVLGVTARASLSLLVGQREVLSAAGWDVQIVVGEPTLDNSSADTHIVPMRRDPSPIRDFIALLRWVRLLRNLRPAIVVIGTPKAALLGLMASWICRVQHRLYLQRGLRLETTSGARRRLFHFLEWLTARASTEVIAVSDSLADTYVRERLSSTRPTVLGHGGSNGVVVPPEGEISDLQRANARRALGLPSESHVVAFVGRIQRDKGLDLVMRACSGLDPMPVLLVAGTVEDRSLYLNLERFAREAKLDARFLGHVDPRPAYLAADLHVLMSDREGLPNVVLEAGAHGTPSIVSDATGCLDAVDDGVTGRISPRGDVEALRSTLRVLLADPRQRKVMGAAARNRVAEHFERSVVQDQFRAHIDRISSGK